MKRVSRDKTVPNHERYQVREPVAEVELDEAFVVETINFRTPIIRTAADANPEVYREREETGPIFVKGIEPGDVLAIHILDVRPEGHASGGNMNFRDIASGNTLCLRVELPGDLLVIGDVHAYQGDGEILGLGAECAAEVTIRVTKEKTFLSDRPLIKKTESFVAIASRPDYAEARDLAVEDATNILSRVAGCTKEEAYLYVTTAGELRNGAVWHMGKTEPEWVKTANLTVGVEVPLYGIAT